MRTSAILVGIVAAILGSESDVRAQSYPMVCRGPLTVEFGQNHQPTLRMIFGRGRKPATQGVEPGTCAWMDRGVRNDEPRCLMHSPRDVRVRVVQPSSVDRPSAPAAESFRSDVAGRAVRREPGSGQAPDSGALRATPPRFEISSMNEAPYLASIVTSSAKTHIFQAYRKEGWECLEVERLGP